MNSVSHIKRFQLRALGRATGMAWPDALLDEAARQGFLRRPVQRDLNAAKRELELAGYIQSTRNGLDGLLTWTLTDKGRDKARRLG